MKLPYNDGYNRHYICKLCGKEAIVPYNEWQKLSQKNKRVCPNCLNMRYTKALDYEESLMEPFPYGRI